MTPNTLATVAAWSYSLALAAYLAFALLMALRWRPSIRSALLLAATLVTAVWAASCLAVALSDRPPIWLLSGVTDVFRYGVWFLFVGNLIAGAGGAKAPLAFPRWVAAVVAAAMLASFALLDGLPLARLLGAQGQRVSFGLHLGLAVFGLMLVEQLFRRAHPQARWAIKPLCIALAGVFGFELFLYADAMLFTALDVNIWAARGVVNALVVPLIAIAMARNPRWAVEMHVSRDMVLQSTALLVSAAFLLAVAAAGYLVRYLGGEWGRTLQIELLFAALVGGALVISSGRFRSRLKVFVSKHFYSYRYDYRQAWLRFTSTLSTDSAGQGLPERVTMALADLVESPAGMLWLDDGSGSFRLEARWNAPALAAVESAGASLAAFLARTDWVISVDEVLHDPGKYADLQLPGWLTAIRDAWLIVPLPSSAGLLGFVVLMTPRAKIDVDWEVRDLLKTASRQAASYLGQLRATEALLEARKFEAFNRMSAFVVHDLKNLVAQLSLMLRNAERHSENPEFQRDMLTTVEHVVERMHKLMLQLRTGATPVENARPVDLETVVRRVCAAKATLDRPIELELSTGVTAAGHEDRLEHVIGHLVQNAIDATSKGGSVTVRLHDDGAFALIDVKDTGTGMSPEFIRERLFRPFETTKPAGMGIGVYESSQYVAGLGGQILVDSEPGQGTRVRVLLPRGEGRISATVVAGETA
ncbi:MAG: XrtA/PEP-CTERM system histidine kinase PrsK [Betaproteobacteria bacterium]